MTNESILQTALRQSAIDMSCDPADFLNGGNRVVESRANLDARKYLNLPFDCNLVCYGSGIVASVGRPELAEPVKCYIDRFPAEHCFETPNMHVLSELLAEYDLKLCFMAEYFLPDLNALQPRPCDYELRWMTQPDFASLYLAQWSNALCEKRRELDVLGVGAYHNGELVGLAGCSADCDSMWQIGIDVLPEYRRQGIAEALTSRLALGCVERGKVPFYCAAWSNIRSVRNAIACGFRPAWVELTAKPKAFVDEMNRG